MKNDLARPSGVNDAGLPLADDLMMGSHKIAEFIFGDSSETNRRRVYHAGDKLGLPTFKLGGTLCGRRSKIIAWIEKQENAA